MTLSPFDRLGEKIAHEQDVLRARMPYQDQVRARLASFELPPVDAPRSFGFGLWLRSATAALAVAAGVVLALQLRTPQAPEAPLGLFIGDSSEPTPAGRWIEAPSTGNVALRFSDGSHIEVAEHSRARVVELNPHGADVALESGALQVQVRHRAKTAWRVSAGPFGVRVTGTRFQVRWKPEEDAFELNLSEGSVELSGCVFGQGYQVKTGQTVRASCRSERFDVSFGNGSRAEASAITPVVPATTTQTAASEVTSAPQLTAAPTQSGVSKNLAWEALARRGRFAEAYSLVKAVGFQALCARADAEHLSLLADLARYGRDSGAEARALHVLRKRFAGTKRATLAAFALGRLEFDDHGSYVEAAEWFRAYLREQPSGELAREASGRLLESTARSGRLTLARELAAAYLRDYPRGPHAELARGLSASAERQ